MSNGTSRDEIDAILNRIISGEFTQRDIDALRAEFKRLYRQADLEADEDRLLSNMDGLDFTRGTPNEENHSAWMDVGGTP